MNFRAVSLYTILLTVLKTILTLESSQTLNSQFAFNSFQRVMADSTTVLSTKASCRSVLECSIYCMKHSPQCVGYSFDTDCITYSSISQNIVPTAKAVFLLYSEEITTTGVPTTVTTTTTAPPTTTTQAPSTVSLIPYKDCYFYGMFYLMPLENILRCIRPVNEMPVFGTEANPYCEPDGKAVALETKQKIDDYRNYLKGIGKYEMSGYWIGLDHDDTLGQFIWDKHGQQAPTTGDIWEGGAPNVGTGKKCIALIGNKYLQAKDCTTLYRYACEIDIYTP